MTFKTVQYQSIYDLAVQLFANVQALPVLLNTVFTGDIDLSAAIQVGLSVSYDLENDVTRKKVLKGMDNTIVHTYKIHYENNENAEFNTDFNFDFTS